MQGKKITASLKLTEFLENCEDLSIGNIKNQVVRYLTKFRKWMSVPMELEALAEALLELLFKILNFTLLSRCASQRELRK